MKYNTTILKLMEDNEEDQEKDDDDQVGPFKAIPVNTDASRKLLLKISLFERKKHTTSLNIHHNGQCNTIKIPDSPRSSTNSTYHTTFSCTDDEFNEPDNNSMEKLCQLAEHPITQWNDGVKYQVLETSVAAANKTHKYKPFKPIRKVSTSKVRPIKMSRANRYKIKQTYVKTVTKNPTESSYAQTLSSSSDHILPSSVKLVPVRESIITPCFISSKLANLWQKSTGIQKYLEDYHQVSKSIQFNSEQSLKIPNANYLTVVKPNKSDSSILDSPQIREEKNESIIDLFHTLNLSDFSDRITLTRSDPSFSINLPSSKDEIVTLMHKYTKQGSVYVQTEMPLQLTPKNPSWSYIGSRAPNPLKFDKFKVLNGVFPVLSPSGQQIGSLIGATTKKSIQHKYNPGNPGNPGDSRHPEEVDQEGYSKSCYHQFNAVVTPIPSKKYSKLSSKVASKNSKLTKNFQTPVVIPPSKEFISRGLQTDGQTVMRCAMHDQCTGPSFCPLHKFFGSVESRYKGSYGVITPMKSPPQRSFLQKRGYRIKKVKKSRNDFFSPECNSSHPDRLVELATSLPYKQKPEEDSMQEMYKWRLKYKPKMAKTTDANTTTSGTQGLKNHATEINFGIYSHPVRNRKPEI